MVLPSPAERYELEHKALPDLYELLVPLSSSSRGSRVDWRLILDLTCSGWRSP